MDMEYWENLIEALTLLKQHPTGVRPTHCEHDILTVMADPAKFTPAEIERLEQLSFDADGDGVCFTSSRFGSA